MEVLCCPRTRSFPTIPWSEPKHEEQRCRLSFGWRGSPHTVLQVFLEDRSFSRADVVGDESACRCLKVHLLLFGGFPSRRHKGHL
jgi:hypothetical protein